MMRSSNRRLFSSSRCRSRIAGEIASGALVEIGAGEFARRQQVVYAGVFTNEVARIDVAQSTFTADFYLWIRFARSAGVGAADPTEIDFPDLVRGTFERRSATERDLDDGTTYLVRGVSAATSRTTLICVVTRWMMD